MPKKISKLVSDVHLNCFGEFRASDDVCKNHCSLSIKCLIEKNQNTQMEIFEEMMAAEMMSVRLQ